MLTQLQPQTEASSAHVRADAAAVGVQDKGVSSCCIGCFRLMSSPPESPPECSDDIPDPPEPELLCASCILHLAGKTNTSPAVQSGGGVLSPLPKLSLLVKAEAKCQDQMQFLRAQHEVLRQQRESLHAAKRAKEEALAAERELARQRRRHFLMLQERRKREEELKFQQFQGEEHTSRSEQEGNACKSKVKPKPPKVHQSLQRRKSEPGPKLSEESLPHLAMPISKLDDTPHSHVSTTSDNASSAVAHTTSLCERRRQMMVCYSQDLSPLIYGRKPKRLPFPKPVAAIVPTGVIKRRQTPDNNAQVATIASTHRNKNQQKGKSSASKVTKLRPLDDEKKFITTRPQQSNQFEDFHGRGNHETARRLVGPSAPLTAEIKPVSWANELLPQDCNTNEVCLSLPLDTVAEEAQDYPQFTMFPLQHQLPKPTFPPSKPEEVATKVPRWEYSAERLSSLLEKYNVSVSAVSTVPKL